MINNYDISNLENIYQYEDIDIDIAQNQSYDNSYVVQNTQQRPIPTINYPNVMNNGTYNAQINNYNVPQYNQYVDNNYDNMCDNNCIGSGIYKKYRKLYICTENPNTPGAKMFEEISLDDDIYYNKRVSQDLIETLMNFLKISGFGNIERYVDYDELLNAELKEPHVAKEIVTNDTTINISKNSVTVVDEEAESGDLLFGLLTQNNIAENDKDHEYSPVRYQYYRTFDKELYVYTKDKVFVPIYKKFFNKDPNGLKDYVCIIKTYDLDPKFLSVEEISKVIEHIASNTTRINGLKNENEIKKLKDIAKKNYVNYKNNGGAYLKPIRIRIITYIPEFELRYNNYCLYIKSLGITISNNVMNYKIDEIENMVDEDKFINSIKVITDLSDNNDYYYQLNDKIITLPKTIDNTTESKIIIEENLGKQCNVTEINMEDIKDHNIYTDKEELKSIIYANKNKTKELENKWKELDIKEKELSVKEKEIEFKQYKIAEDKESYSRTDSLEDFAKAATAVIGVATAAVGLGLACWKLYSLIKG